jgi:hypothetical protein
MRNSRLNKKHPATPAGIRLLKGALASKKGKGMSFVQIREAAANNGSGRERAR